MATLQTLPPEIVYDTLVRASEADIMNYCATSVDAHIICTDPIFWLRKLDYDFDIGNSLKPSYYAQRYNTDKDRHVTYTRWKTYVGDHPMVNMDIIIYNINQGIKLKNERADKISLMRYALIHNDQDLLQILQMKNLLISPKDSEIRILLDIMNTAGEINVHVMQWLEDYGMPITQDLVDEFCSTGNINILNWLYTKNILPTYR